MAPDPRERGRGGPRAARGQPAGRRRARPAVPAGAGGQDREEPLAPRPATRRTRPPRSPGSRRSAPPGRTSARGRRLVGRDGRPRRQRVLRAAAVHRGGAGPIAAEEAAREAARSGSSYAGVRVACSYECSGAGPRGGGLAGLAGFTVRCCPSAAGGQAVCSYEGSGWTCSYECSEAGPRGRGLAAPAAAAARGQPRGHIVRSYEEAGSTPRTTARKRAAAGQRTSKRVSPVVGSRSRGPVRPPRAGGRCGTTRRARRRRRRRPRTPPRPCRRWCCAPSRSTRRACASLRQESRKKTPCTRPVTSTCTRFIPLSCPTARLGWLRARDCTRPTCWPRSTGSGR